MRTSLSCNPGIRMMAFGAVLLPLAFLMGCPPAEDTTSPTVSMSSAAADPANTSPISVTVTFSESVTGFSSADVIAVNGVVSNFSGSGASYTFDLTPSGDGLVTADIGAGAAQDAASNPNTAAAQFSRTYESGGGDWAEDTTTFNVTFAENTTQVTEDAMALVLASNDETYTYTLDAAAVQSAGLDLSVGRNLVLHGLAMRRITSVETTGGETTVETEFVPLNEVITDGTIAWDYGVEFTAQKIRSVVGPDGIEVPTKAGEPIDLTFSNDGLEYHIQMTLEDTQSAVTITVTKGIGDNVSASFVMAGTIERFRSANTIEIQGGALRQFNSELSGMKGDVTLELIVAGSGADAVNYKPTMTLMKVPFTVGPIPVQLDIRIQFVINASVPVSGSARVRTNFQYDSDLGFSYNGTSVSAGGSLAGITFGDNINETGAPSAISANFGVGFPRIELSVMGVSLGPWAQTAFLVGGSFTMSPPCQTADAQFLGAVGYDLSLFDLPEISGSITLFSETTPLLRTGDCPEDAKFEGAWRAESALAEGF